MPAIAANLSLTRMIFANIVEFCSVAAVVATIVLPAAAVVAVVVATTTKTKALVVEGHITNVSTKVGSCNFSFFHRTDVRKNTRMAAFLNEAPVSLR